VLLLLLPSRPTMLLRAAGLLATLAHVAHADTYKPIIGVITQPAEVAHDATEAGPAISSARAAAGKKGECESTFRHVHQARPHPPAARPRLTRAAPHLQTSPPRTSSSSKPPVHEPCPSTTRRTRRRWSTSPSR
jgi:hypothetical protein